MANIPIDIRAAAAVGIVTSSFISGVAFSTSYFTVPALLASPTPLCATSWLSTYNTGKYLAPPMAAFAAASYMYAAYVGPQPFTHSRSQPFILAATLAISTIPYTIIVMGGTNRKLMEKAENMRSLGSSEGLVEIGEDDDEKTKVLVDKWSTYNAGRSLLSLTGALTGIWAILS